MNKKFSFYGKQSILALAVASGLTFIPALAEAAGLGKITVYSALGQPLRAEVLVSATTEEILGMTARLAPADSFRESGVEFSPTLLHLQFTTEKRPGGAVIKITSDKPINDPFLDFLLELNWPSGRLVREYTFLLDPIDIATPPPQQIAPRIVAAQPKAAPPPKQAEADVDELINLEPEADTQKRPAAAQPQPQAQPQPRPAPEKVVKQETKPPPAKTIEPAPAPSKQEERIEHQVRSGETLHRIATQNMPDGVSLEQMLVSLYRNNSDAFTNNNMNRLRAGAILRMPTQAEATAISPEEARKVFRTQSSDWNAYRRRLASATQSMPARETDDRSASGRVTASVDEKAALPDQPKDQVKVSPTEQGKGKPGASQEDLVAKENALREAQDRINQLETTINKQEQLLKLNAQRLAELEKQAQTATTKPATSAAPAVAPTVAPTPPAVPPVAPEPPPVQVAASEASPPPAVPPAGETPPATDAPPATEPAPTAAEGTAPPEAEAPTEVAPPTPEATMPPPPKRVEKPPVPAVVEEEPGFLESIGLMPLLAGLAAIGGGIGLLLYRRRRAQQMESVAGSDFSGDASSFTIGPNSVFNTAGGQSVDTASTPAPPATEFSLAGPGAIDTHEVDPVSEADVYMAYGRDTQAEEILLDALQKDPQRVAIHTKLLEIYAGRRSIKQFETLSSELYSLTGGNGPEWEKVVAMGKGIDPTNPLYGGASASDAAQSDRMSVAPESKPRGVHSIPPPSMSSDQDDPLLSLPSEPQDTYQPSPQAAPVLPPLQPVAEPAVAVPAASSSASPPPMEFSYTAPKPVVEQEELSSTATVVNSAAVLDALDFDLSLDESSPTPPPPPAPSQPQPVQTAAAPASSEIGFGTDSGSATFLNLGLVTQDEKAPEAQLAPPSILPSDGDEEMEFDMNLTASTVLGNVIPSSFDLSSIDLDLTSKPPEQTGETGDHDTLPDSQRDEVNTKLDLAKAYEDMGDLEGAMELLKEVLNEGAPDQVETAQTNLTRLGA